MLISIGLGFLALVLCATGTAPAAEPPLPEPAVSLASYWRYWLTARPPVTSEPLVEKGGRKLTELAVPRGWHISGQVRSITTPDPATNWEQPDFDDSAWPVQRVPACTERPQEMWDQPLTVRRLAGRIRFEVPDPAAVRSLKLSAAYKGGMVVYLNGQEVARKHVAAGTLKPDDFAEAYPKGAYMPEDEKEAATGKKLWQGTHSGCWTGVIEWGWRDQPELKAICEKIRGLRNRSLGPVEIPGKLLRKGTNVLAVDVRQAAIAPVAHKWDWYSDETQTNFWAHLWIDDLRLAAEPSDALKPVVRPAGTQLWGEDIHRWIFNADFLEPGAKARPVEIVAARGGQFSGQAVIGSANDLNGPSAAVSDLAGPAGAKLPAAAVRVRWGVPLTLTGLLENYGKGALRTTFPDQSIVRYAEHLGLGKELAARRWPHRVLELAGPTRLALFDRLADMPPARIPANSSQTIWLTVAVPKDAAPGEYRGKLTVRGDAFPESSLEVKVTVTGFALPAPQEWATFVGIEESPYSTAKGCNLTLWSDDHWKREEECLAWLGGLGNKLVQVPLISGTELGNAESMVAWMRKGEGYDYDWTILDRYLALARRHCGRPLALVALVHPPADLKGKKLSVTLLEGDARKPLELPEPGTPEFNKVWLPFAKAFAAHVREKSLADSVHWGIFFDECPKTLQAMAQDMAADMPDIGWLRSSHDGNRTRPFPRTSKAQVSLDAHIRAFAEPDWAKGGVGRKGWSRPDLNVLYPREASQVTAIPAYAPLWHLRELPELAVSSDARGFSRVGANYWERFSGGWFVPAVLYILYPGKGRVEGSVQLETLREGLQECEARIAIERKDPESVLLKERTGAAWLLPGGTSHGRIGEFYGGWQERSRKLYEAAAK